MFGWFRKANGHKVTHLLPVQARQAQFFRIYETSKDGRVRQVASMINRALAVETATDMSRIALRDQTGSHYSVIDDLGKVHYGRVSE